LKQLVLSSSGTQKKGGSRAIGRCWCGGENGEEEVGAAAAGKVGEAGRWVVSKKKKKKTMGLVDYVEERWSGTSGIQRRRSGAFSMVGDGGRVWSVRRF
jgi:hypothetical protein